MKCSGERRAACSVFLEGVLSIYLEGAGSGLCVIDSLDSSLVIIRQTPESGSLSVVRGQGGRMCG